jgi:hypothetical protein
MSYTKDHEISLRVPNLFEKRFRTFKTNFTYALVLHAGDNQTLIARRKRINLHINAQTPVDIFTTFVGKPDNEYPRRKRADLSMSLTIVNEERLEGR